MDDKMNMYQNENPFNTGSPARGQNFFGRKEIIDDILLFLKKSSESTFLLSGQRRIGKTSLLRKLQDDRELVAPARPVYFNLQDKARSLLPQLLLEIAQRIVLDLDLNIKVNEEDFTNSKGPDFFKEKFIPSVCAELGGSKPLVLLLDEFDVLGDIEVVEGDASLDVFAFRSFIPFVDNLVESIRQKKYPLKFVFAIGRNYKDLDTKRYGPLTKFAKNREISYFSKNEVEDLLKKFSTIPLKKEAIDEIYALTSGHPFFIQCLGSAAFDNAEKNGREGISREIVREEFLPTIKSHSSGVYWVWDSLSAHDQIILYLMAVLKEENQPITIGAVREKAFSLNFAPAVEDLARIIERLKTFKFIKESKTGYEFYVEFIRQWIVTDIKEAETAKNLSEIDEEIEIHLINGRYYFRQADYQNAAEHFSMILKKSKHHFEALLYLARSYRKLIPENIQYLEKSLTAYQKAYQLNREKTKTEHQNLFDEYSQYLKKKKLYEKFKPGRQQELSKRISDLKERLSTLENTKLKCDNPSIDEMIEYLDSLRKPITIGITIIFLIVLLLIIFALPRGEGDSIWPLYFMAIFLFLVSIFSPLLLLHTIEGRLRKKETNQYAQHGFDEAEYKHLKKELAETEKLVETRV